MVEVRPDINSFQLDNQETPYEEGGYKPTSSLMALGDAVGDTLEPELSKIYQNDLANKNVKVLGDATQAAETNYRNIIANGDPSNPNNHAILNQQMNDWWNQYKGGLTTDQAQFSNDYVNKLNLDKQSQMVKYGVDYSNSQLLANIDTQQNNILKLASNAPPEMKQVYMDQLDKLRSQAVSIGAMTPEQAAQHEIQGKSDYDINRIAAVAAQNPALGIKMAQQSQDITPERKLTLIENLQHEERQRAFEAQQSDAVGLEGYRIQASGDPSSIPVLLKQMDNDQNISPQGKARFAVMANALLLKSGGTDQQQQQFQDSMINGTVDPHDKAQQTAANYYYNNMVRNNPKATPQQLLSVPLKTGYIPETMQAQILTAASSNDPKQISSAATMLSQISSQRPDALRFMDADPKAKAFLMDVAHMSAGGMAPEAAVKAAQDAQNSGVTEKDMSKFYAESQKFAAKQTTDMTSLQRQFAPPLTFGFDRPTPDDGVQKFANTQYQSSYMQYRATGSSSASSRINAQADVAGMMGTSNVNGDNHLSILPPEKFSKDDGATIRARMLQTLNQNPDAPKVDTASMVADSQTLQEYQAKQSPTYQVVFKNPKTGAIVPVPYRYTADGKVAANGGGR